MESPAPASTARPGDAAPDWPPAAPSLQPGACRFCGTQLRQTVVDLGMSPLSESYVSADRINAAESFYPLRVWVCTRCYLVQLEQYVSREEIFGEYAYFSSYSDSWLDHARRFADQVIPQLGLTAASRVVEVASNDGYLLQYFVARDIPVLGIEPAANVAQAATAKGVNTLVTFFGREVAAALAESGTRADLLVGNNVLAQVHDLNDFVAGLAILLAPGGTITIECPRLDRLLAENQFDTIYHEHFSYFSLYSAERVFAAHGLTVFDVEDLPTHGGSLRIYARHAQETARRHTARMLAVRAREADMGVDTLGCYATFAEQVRETKRKLLTLLIRIKRDHKRVVGYGAPGKGNTLLNYCGIRTDFVDFTVDRSPYKQGKFLPGSRIPVFHPDRLREARPDYVLILPWNLTDEIVGQLAFVREWGGQFIVPIPEPRVLA
jgi:hypothetical protein